MKKLFLLLIAFLVFVFVGLWLTGCTAAEKLADELGEKNVSGSGFLSVQKIGFDTANKIPTMSSTVISGDFQTIKAGTNYLNYKKEATAAWYSSSIKTERQTLTIAIEGKTNMADVLKYAVGVIDKLPEATDAPTGSDAASEAAAPATSE